MLSRARALWRDARSLPVARPLVEAADRFWWARVIRRADIVDLEYVAATAGRALGARRAIRAYVRGGFRRGMSLNPLFVEARVSRQLSDSERVPALYAYLVNDRERLSVSPHWDSVAWARNRSESLEDPAGPLGHAWRVARRGEPITLGPSSAPIAVSWHQFLALAATAARESRGADADLDNRSPQPPPAFRTTIVAVIDDEEDDGDRVIDLIGPSASALGAAVVVGAHRPLPDDWAQLVLMTLWMPGSRVRRIRLAPDAILAALESDVSSGTVVTRGPRAEISTTDFVALARAGTISPTAPLWLAIDGTVAAAGIGSAQLTRFPLLAGHPAEDARALGAELDVHETAGLTRAYPVASSTSGSARTLLTTTVIAPASAMAGASVAPDTDLDALVAPIGLMLTGWKGVGSGLLPVLARLDQPPFVLEDSTAVPRLRWAIKTAAPVGHAGESWGDTHFARGLASALRRLGQQVVIDAYPAHDRASAVLDDVALVLRGPRRIDAPKVAKSSRAIQWIISHPDEVEADELDGFDAVFAASTAWASDASQRFGRDIRPLLQCTDSRVFRPSGSARGDEIVFVGTARGIARPSVVGPISAGVPVSVYGPDWRGYIPAARITATGIPNDLLPALYERAGVVLNDHWPAMRRAGFISNRPYDVVAAGGRVISDEVEGIEEEFEGAVRVYRSLPELVEMLRSDLDALFPPAEHLAEIGARIRARDSFDARARVLLDAVR